MSDFRNSNIHYSILHSTSDICFLPHLMAPYSHPSPSKHPVPRDMQSLTHIARKQHSPQSRIGVKTEGPDSNGQNIHLQRSDLRNILMEIHPSAPAVHSPPGRQRNPKRETGPQMPIFIKNHSMARISLCGSERTRSPA